MSTTRVYPFAPGYYATRPTAGQSQFPYFIPGQTGTDAFQGPQKKSRSFLRTLLIGAGVVGAATAGLFGLKYIKPNWFHTITTEVKKFLPDSVEKVFSKEGFIGKGIEAIKKPFIGDGALSGVTGFIKKILDPIKKLFNKGAQTTV
jgi:hypothetical protein